MGCCGGEDGGCGRCGRNKTNSYIDRLEVTEANLDGEGEDLTIDYIEQHPEQLEEQHYEVPPMEFLDPERHPER